MSVSSVLSGDFEALRAFIMGVQLLGQLLFYFPS
jgi:hypothetical protein